MRDDARDGRVPYDQLNVSACFDYYSHYFTPQGNGFIFVKNESVQDPPTDSLLLYVSVIPRNDDWGKNLWAMNNGTLHHARILTSSPTLVTKWFVGKPHYEVDHCLVQRPPWSEERCQLQYSPWILWTCCISNLIKVLVMVSIWIAARTAVSNKDGRPSVSGKDQPLCTLGDAIASFMKEPDPTTKGMSTATMQDFNVPMLSQCFRLSRESVPCPRWPRPWYPKRKQWRHAISLERWLVFLLA